MVGRALAWLLAAFLAVGLAGCGPPPFIEVSVSPRSASEASVAAFPDGLVVAWYDTRDGHGEIYARALGTDGRPAGPQRRLTHGDHDAFEADAHALGAADFVVGWYEKTTAGRLIPRLGRWGRDGTERWVTTLAPTGRNTVVGVDGDRLFAAWLDDEAGERSGLWAGWWNVDGRPLVAPRRVAEASRMTWNLNGVVAPQSAREEPRAWVVFDATVGTKAEELFLADVRGTTATVVRLSSDDGISSTYPDVAVSGNRISITWFDTRAGNEDVYLAVGDTGELERPDALTVRASRLTDTAGHSIGAYLAWNGERIGVAWSDDTVGEHEVYFQTFDSTGRATQPPRRVTDTKAASLIPAVAPWQTGFALAWNEYDAAAPGHNDGGRGQVAVAVIP